jgi:hypothetical protein
MRVRSTSTEAEARRMGTASSAVKAFDRPNLLELSMSLRRSSSTWQGRRIAALARSFGAAGVLAVGVLSACSSSSSSSETADGGGSSGSSGGSSSGTIEGDAADCTNPGTVTSGPADDHCASAGADGGALVQPVNAVSCCIQTPLPAACSVDAGDGDECPYNSTMWGNEGDDDDCKYHVTWTSGPLCENSSGTIQIPFTVHVTNLGDGTPMASDANTEVRAEVFTTTPGDASAPGFCDDQSTHPAPGSEFHFTQSTTMPGYWSGLVDFDQAGQWTVRFHFHEECLDVLDDSPHGHAAFYVTLN